MWRQEGGEGLLQRVTNCPGGLQLNFNLSRLACIGLDILGLHSTYVRSEDNWSEINSSSMFSFSQLVKLVEHYLTPLVRFVQNKFSQTIARNKSCDLNQKFDLKKIFRTLPEVPCQLLKLDDALILTKTEFMTHLQVDLLKSGFMGGK